MTMPSSRGSGSPTMSTPSSMLRSIAAAERLAALAPPARGEEGLGRGDELVAAQRHTTEAVPALQPVESRALETAPGQVRLAQLDAPQVARGDRGATELGRVEVGFVQVAGLQLTALPGGHAQVGVVELAVDERDVGEAGCRGEDARHPAADELDPRRPHLLEHGARQVAVGEDAVPERDAPEVGTGEPGRLDAAAVELEERHHRAGVVPADVDAFPFGLVLERPRLRRQLRGDDRGLAGRLQRPR